MGAKERGQASLRATARPSKSTNTFHRPLKPPLAESQPPAQAGTRQDVNVVLSSLPSGPETIAGAGRVDVGGWNTWGRGGAPESSPEIIAKVRRTLGRERVENMWKRRSKTAADRRDELDEVVEKVCKARGKLSCGKVYAEEIRPDVAAEFLNRKINRAPPAWEIKDSLERIRAKRKSVDNFG
jgi:hypothetical protein